MGLDIVELVMRTEEVFGVDLPDWKAESASTVGNLYCVICEELGVVPLADPESSAGRKRRLGKVSNLEVVVWTPEDVWATLVWVVVDQLQVDVDEVRFEAQWGRDLRAD